MLDIGCGGGATLQRLLKRSKEAKVYGIDISEESVAKAKKVNADVLESRYLSLKVQPRNFLTRTGSSTS